MKLATYLVPLFLSVAAADFFGNFGQQVLNDDKSLSVPGENPLIFCEDPKDDILTIEKVDLSPNPPEAGKNLTISATGVFTDKVEEGAFVWLTVKFGLIRIIYKKEDLCEQMKNIDTDCPIEKGKVVITKVVELPKQIPPGTFSVLGDVYTKEEKKITCLKATVKF